LPTLYRHRSNLHCHCTHAHSPRREPGLRIPDCAAVIGGAQSVSSTGSRWGWGRCGVGGRSEPRAETSGPPKPPSSAATARSLGRPHEDSVRGCPYSAGDGY
jgi:hypothetical protein